MDSATFSMLRDLPEDLSTLGWEVDHESGPRRGGKRFAAVYVRPFDHAIDENPTTAFSVVQIRGRSCIRVSSDSERTQTPEAAYQVALERMRDVDARRRNPE